ncbi:MAG: histidine phosphatase family protein [Pikeienuella sp.]
MQNPPRPFLYLRHGQTEWNKERRVQGRTDIPLNETGLAQAAAAAERLSGVRVDRIIASPMKRAAQTAEVVAASKGLPISWDDRLRERFFGAFDGMLLTEIRDQLGYGDGLSIWSLNGPDSEPMEDALARTLECMSEHLADSDDQVLFVAHGALLALLAEHLFGERLDSGNAIPWSLAEGSDGWHAEAV